MGGIHRKVNTKRESSTHLSSNVSSITFSSDPTQSATNCSYSSNSLGLEASCRFFLKFVSNSLPAGNFNTADNVIVPEEKSFKTCSKTRMFYKWISWGNHIEVTCKIWVQSILFCVIVTAKWIQMNNGIRGAFTVLGRSAEGRKFPDRWNEIPGEFHYF